MRVIAGQYRRRTLRSLPGVTCVRRPTVARDAVQRAVRGQSRRAGGTTWLDLYAGTGAVGIEALSRGARMVYFVESSKAAAELIAAEPEIVGIDGDCERIPDRESRRRKSLAAIGSGGETVAGSVFLDPPYRLREEYAKTLMALAGSKLLNERSVVIAEHEKRFDPGEAFGELRRYRKLEQGDAALSFYRRVASSSCELRETIADIFTLVRSPQPAARS